MENAFRQLRVGQGYDVHRLVLGRPLVIGGVTIPHPAGLLGHSDADVLTHAVIDALLGGAALGDIGQLFPDNDERWRNADSLNLLRMTRERITSAGFYIVNLDCTVMAQEPKLAPHIPAMRAALSSVLDIGEDRCSIKAKTGEQIGVVGRKEGIAAQAIVLLTASVH